MVNKQPTPQINGWYVAKLLGELGFIIAIPLVVFLLVGRSIDIKLGTKVLFTLLGMGVALVSSSLVIYKKIQLISAKEIKITKNKLN